MAKWIHKPNLTTQEQVQVLKDKLESKRMRSLWVLQVLFASAIIYLLFKR